MHTALKFFRDWASYGSAILMSFLPHLRLGHAAPNPQDYQRRQDADEERRPPIGIVQHDTGHQRGQCVPNGP